MAKKHSVHLVCFARHESEIEFANKLKDRCASVYVELLPFAPTLIKAGMNFLGGGSLNMAFYRSRAMQQYVKKLAADVSLQSTVAYALPMAPYAPEGVPVLLDMQDVDSEKWLEYSRMRRLGSLYKWEALRLRKQELRYAALVNKTFLTARQETELFRELAPLADVECMENGVDCDFFDPSRVPVLPELTGRRYASFVGTMDYFPNIDAAVWFARQVLPELRKLDSEFEFLIVGNNPAKSVLQLAQLPGVTVTGGVPDVRPYVMQSTAVVAPLRLARGIQNKVLEALVLGRNVFATTPVCKTFGEEVPSAIVRCDSVGEFVSEINSGRYSTVPSAVIREQGVRRFTWSKNLELFTSRLEEMMHSEVVTVGHGRGGELDDSI